MNITIGMTVKRTCPKKQVSTFTIENEKQAKYHMELQAKGFVYKDEDDWLSVAEPVVVKKRVHISDSTCNSCEG